MKIDNMHTCTWGTCGREGRRRFVEALRAVRVHLCLYGGAGGAAPTHACPHVHRTGRRGASPASEGVGRRCAHTCRRRSSCLGGGARGRPSLQVGCGTTALSQAGPGSFFDGLIPEPDYAAEVCVVWGRGVGGVGGRRPAPPPVARPPTVQAGCDSQCERGSRRGQHEYLPTYLCCSCKHSVCVQPAAGTACVWARQAQGHSH